jgi:hypothetical protein
MLNINLLSKIKNEGEYCIEFGAFFTFLITLLKQGQRPGKF